MVEPSFTICKVSGSMSSHAPLGPKKEKEKNRSSPLMKGKEYFFTGIHPATDCIAKQPVCDYMTMKFILLLCLNLVDTISIMCIHVFSASARSYIRLTKLWSRSYIVEHERFM